MEKNLWLAYVAFYVTFTAWATWRLPGSFFISATDIIHMCMLVGIVGLAVNKTI